jgi:hypothetical protein
VKQRVTLWITLIYLMRFQPGWYWTKAGIASGLISLVVDTRCRPFRPHYVMVCGFLGYITTWGPGPPTVRGHFRILKWPPYNERATAPLKTLLPLIMPVSLCWIMPWQPGITPWTSGSTLVLQAVMPSCQGITLHTRI